MSQNYVDQPVLSGLLLSNYFPDGFDCRVRGLFGGLCFFRGKNMQKQPHRTIVYIDGFNFYYGEIKGTQWKWLDPVALFQNVLGVQNKLVKIKYFTARVQPTPNDPDVNIRQDT